MWQAERAQEVVVNGVLHTISLRGSELEMPAIVPRRTDPQHHINPFRFQYPILASAFVFIVVSKIGTLD
ncbi:hypothetical protein BOTBODRAFT_36325, partial [Botryobasidium botryosum FD-172 SS1]